MFYSGFTVTRLEGVVALLGYAAYTALMILPGDAFPASWLKTVVTHIFVPATIAWLAFATFVQARRDRVRLDPKGISLASRP